MYLTVQSVCSFVSIFFSSIAGFLLPFNVLFLKNFYVCVNKFCFCIILFSFGHHSLVL